MPSHTAIGLLGGTFDPIHFGHLRLALELHTAFSLSQVRLIPCYQPVHRPAPIASAAQRLEMVTLAIRNESALFADSREIQRAKPSYTIDTLKEIRQEMPHHALCLFIGIDAFLDFLNWRHPQGILEHAHVIVAHRPSYHLPPTGSLAEFVQKHIQQNPRFIHEHPAGGLFFHPITALDISASQIRKQIALKQNPRYLLPDAVYDYLLHHGIYHRT